MGLIRPVTAIYQDGAIAVYRFQHTGPSRSGEATITFSVTNDDNEGPVCYGLVYTHHEGQIVYDLNGLQESIQMEEDPVFKQDLLSIVTTIYNTLVGSKDQTLN